MEHFVIFVDGVPPIEVANQFWRDIVRFGVNFMVLDKQSYIYGNATDETIAELMKKAEVFGFPLNIERGE